MYGQFPPPPKKNPAVIHDCILYWKYNIVLEIQFKKKEKTPLKNLG
jgi:hypothetical protein